MHSSNLMARSLDVSCVAPKGTAGRIIVLNGFPGTGKLTILQRAKEVLHSTTTPCILLDNHLLIDPVVAILPDRDDEHHELRRRIRAPVFQKLRQRAREGCTVLMTACLAQDIRRDADLLEEHFDLVRGSDIPLIWVDVSCEQTILEERLRSPERHTGTKTKLTDRSVLRRLICEHLLIEPGADRPVNVAVKVLDASGEVNASVQLLLGIISMDHDPARS
jgi:chloramphenicol 3-O-phosphotransferase